MSGRLGSYLALATIGVAWGLTVPLGKIAVSTGHHPYGLIFWEMVLGMVLLGSALSIARKVPRLRPRGAILAVFIALAGTVLPNYFSYTAAAQLPAGVMAIVIAIVPMFSMPIAIALGLERPQFLRLLGVLLGAGAIALIFGPSASLPDPAKAVFVLVALVAPFCYGVEANVLSWNGDAGLGPVGLLFWASVAGFFIVTPLTFATGNWVDLRQSWTAAEFALFGLATLHIGAYCGYIWLVGAAGAVFASQVAYLVTASGVLWSIGLMGETYSGWIWGALVLMLAGIVLVSPKQVDAEQ